MIKVIKDFLPKNIQDNFKLQLFDERKLKLVNGFWDLKSCVGNKFIKESCL